MLDAVTALNQMRVARALGLQTFALWRLGSEDDSLWKIWDSPLKSNPVIDLANVSPGQDVDTEGDGDILRVTGLPQSGHRTVTMDDDTTIPSQVSERGHGDDGLLSPALHRLAVRIPPQGGIHHLRRRA
jgi:hypothetical protein